MSVMCEQGARKGEANMFIVKEHGVIRRLPKKSKWIKKKGVQTSGGNDNKADPIEVANL